MIEKENFMIEKGNLQIERNISTLGIIEVGKEE
jgi:hypothetical protein